jgi:hypothetical protein
MAPCFAQLVLALRHRIEMPPRPARSTAAHVIENLAEWHRASSSYPRNDMRSRLAVKGVAVAVESTRREATPKLVHALSA